MIDAITHTYKLKNEDSYGMTEHGFWVMDGASALKKNNYTSEGNDVVWMVNWWNHYLNEHLEQLDRSIVDLLEEGVDQFNADFSKFTNVDTLSKLDRASTGIAIGRMNGGKVECFVLGDVEINIQKKEGVIDVLTDERIEPLDREVMTMIANNPHRENEIVFSGYTSEELQVLQRNRMKMNTEEGYNVLEHDRDAIKKGIYRAYPQEEISAILAMTDGYSAICNKYEAFDRTELIDVCKNKGVKKVLEKIRVIEDNDQTMTTYKRLRLHDDATAVFLNGF